MTVASGGIATTVVRAFPSRMAYDARFCASVIPPSESTPMGESEVLVGGERVLIPDRIYNDEPETESLSRRQRIIVACLYTRHHDGYVRQRNLERILAEDSPWTVPYVVRLAGEYVWQIVRLIDAELTGDIGDQGSRRYALYGRFAADNPAFIDRTRARAASYWALYHRPWCPSMADHPGRRFTARVAAAGRVYARDERARRRGAAAR